MSRYNGRHVAGAARVARDLRRTEAEARNARTPRERTKAFRREQARARAALTPTERAKLRDSLRSGEEDAA